MRVVPLQGPAALAWSTRGCAALEHIPCAWVWSDGSLLAGGIDKNHRKGTDAPKPRHYHWTEYYNITSCYLSELIMSDAISIFASIMVCNSSSRQWNSGRRMPGCLPREFYNDTSIVGNKLQNVRCLFTSKLVSEFIMQSFSCQRYGLWLDECIRAHGVKKWSICPWLPSECVNRGNEPSCSGKEEIHKHKQFCPVTAWVKGRGSPDRVARGQIFMCYVRNPRNINMFVQAPAGRMGDQGGRETVYVPDVYVPSLALIVQEGKRSLNIKFLGGISRGLPGEYPAGRPGQKPFTPSLGAQENNGHQWPEGLSEKLYAGKLQAEFFFSNPFCL